MIPGVAESFLIKIVLFRMLSESDFLRIQLRIGPAGVAKTFPFRETFPVREWTFRAFLGPLGLIWVNCGRKCPRFKMFSIHDVCSHSTQNRSGRSRKQTICFENDSNQKVCWMKTFWLAKQKPYFRTRCIICPVPMLHHLQM